MPTYDLIPWVAAWSGEQENTGRVWAEPDGVRTDFLDSSGKFYWFPTPTIYGMGVPLLGQVHPLRQSISMRAKRCQVCRVKMDSATWILPSPDSEPTDLITTPPTCLACIEKALQVCPHLSKSHSKIYRVHSYRESGINGNVMNVAGSPQMHISFDDIAALRWTVAKQLIVQWNSWEIV